MSKVAIVTGAGQGIGFAISKRLVEDGVKVGVLDYDAETAEKAVAELSEDKAFSVVADVSKQAEVAAAFQKVVDGITQTLARDLADSGITVNAYAPGIVKTPMMFDIAHEVGKMLVKMMSGVCKLLLKILPSNV